MTEAFMPPSNFLMQTAAVNPMTNNDLHSPTLQHQYQHSSQIHSRHPSQQHQQHQGLLSYHPYFINGNNNNKSASFQHPPPPRLSEPTANNNSNSSRNKTCLSLPTEPSHQPSLISDHSLSSSNTADFIPTPSAISNTLPTTTKRGGGRGRKRRSVSAAGTTDEEDDDPLDEESQKRKKSLERNRIAAYKCRQKKKNWIQDLEQKAELNSLQNEKLRDLVSRLKEENMYLRNLLLAHANCNCEAVQDYLRKTSANIIKNTATQQSMMVTAPIPSSAPTQDQFTDSFQTQQEEYSRRGSYYEETDSVEENHYFASTHKVIRPEP